MTTPRFACRSCRTATGKQNEIRSNAKHSTGFAIASHLRTCFIQQILRADFRRPLVEILGIELVALRLHHGEDVTPLLLGHFSANAIPAELEENDVFG